MIALGIRYLTKYAVATDLTREHTEWPPHPGRVFMAMAAAHFEDGAKPSERVALEWLEAAPPPAIQASETNERSTVRAYVPVNDVHGGIFNRPRQDRTFLCTRPHDDCVFLIWDAEPAPAIRTALGALCSKVTRIGHSSSAVQMWLVPEGDRPKPNWVPGHEFNGARLRVTNRGTLEELEAAFNGAAIEEYDRLSAALSEAKGKEKARLKGEIQSRFPAGRPESSRPRLVHWQGYGRVEHTEEAPEPVLGPFDEDFIVLGKTEGSMLGLESTLQLTGALRNRAMKTAGTPVPEWLSGHDLQGTPSRDPHVAFFPLPYVGFEHADGHVMGLGVAIPRVMRLAEGGSREAELRRCLGPLFFDVETGEERDIEIWQANVWRWTLERETRERPPSSLRRSTWTRASRKWASITPVVLHHYPKKRAGDIERIVKAAFVSAQFPEPVSITVRSISELEGAGHAMSVPPFNEGGGDLCRYQTHVVARFDVPVRGPMLVGRGRFRGYGLFRPSEDAL